MLIVAGKNLWPLVTGLKKTQFNCKSLDLNYSFTTVAPQFINQSISNNWLVMPLSVQVDMLNSMMGDSTNVMSRRQADVDIQVFKWVA